MIPWVREWHEAYAGDDFIAIGMHYPEFGYEEVYENVLEATAELGVEYPVALDNEGETWRAYRQRYWPTRYLIDKRGHIRYQHIGEGAYDETEAYIRQLMAEADPPSS